MLKIKLFVVEDEIPEKVYRIIRKGLDEWIFVKKGLVDLASEDASSWAINYQEWKSIFPDCVDSNDLVFCTIDLKIPEDEGDEATVDGGIKVLKEMKSEFEHARCCVLTGMEAVELEAALGKHQIAFNEVLFASKESAFGGLEANPKGLVSVENYIKSEILKCIASLEFPNPDSDLRQIQLDESSGQVRDLYISKAPYFIEPKSWGWPGLLVGDSGLGAQSFLEFVAYLADASLKKIDLRKGGPKEHRAAYQFLQDVAQELNEEASNGPQRTLVYLPGIDNYMPEKLPEPEFDCFVPLTDILENLLTLAERGDLCPFMFVFGVSEQSRLRIHSSQARAFIRFLEDCIGRMSGYPLQHLGVDELGWYIGHPRMLRIPSLAARGKGFLQKVAEAHLESLDRRLKKPASATDRMLELDDEVQDLLLDKTDWAKAGNIKGLIATLNRCFDNFLKNRADGQFEITRAHLDEDARKQLSKIIINVDDVSLTYSSRNRGDTRVIDCIDFYVEEGEVLVVLGPSGCGKSSILKLISGLAAPSAGSISYRGKKVTKPIREIGMVFQDYSLFPWLTVQQNVEFGPRNRGETLDVYRSRALELLKVAGLYGFRHNLPGQLSGGMRQRVAIIRAIANQSEVLLMDEPFGALDLYNRWNMQEFLLKTAKAQGKTVVFVTHDIEEAVFVGNRIYVASQRPLTLEHCVAVPFSQESRQIELRHDPAFVALVRRISGHILDAAQL